MMHMSSKCYASPEGKMYNNRDWKYTERKDICLPDSQVARLFLLQPKLTPYQNHPPHPPKKTKPPSNMHLHTSMIKVYSNWMLRETSCCRAIMVSDNSLNIKCLMTARAFGSGFPKNMHMGHLQCQICRPSAVDRGQGLEITACSRHVLFFQSNKDFVPLSFNKN